MSAAGEYSAVFHLVKNGATGSWADAAFNSEEFAEKGGSFTLQCSPVHPLTQPFMTWTIHGVSYLFSLPRGYCSLILSFLKLAGSDPAGAAQDPTVVPDHTASDPGIQSLLPSGSNLSVWPWILSVALSCIPCPRWGDSLWIFWILVREFAQTSNRTSLLLLLFL